MRDTLELIARSQQGDQQAKEELVEANTGLIWSVAKRFMGRGTETEDLYQLGCLGFLKAVEGFDLAYGTQFSTSAVPKIAGEIRRFLRDDGAVKVSRGIKERAATIKTTRNQLVHALGREPTILEISRQTGFSPEEIALAETATAAIESIQQETGEEGFSLESVLSDTQTEEQKEEEPEETEEPEAEEEQPSQDTTDTDASTPSQESAAETATITVYYSNADSTDFEAAEGQIASLSP